MEENVLMQLAASVVTDLGGAAIAPLVVVGDKLGLYRALADGAAQSSGELAERAGCAERYVREWLLAQAASGYIRFDPSDGTFSMSEEQAALFADESSPFFMPGAYLTALAGERARPLLEERFRTGAGISWHEHNADLFTGTERMFRPAYSANLLTLWVPALPGVADTLRAGGVVADIGCGLGSSTILLAQEFPASSFVGFDYHLESVEAARIRAKEADLTNIEFQVADAASLPGGGYDLVTCFDALHDMPNPGVVARSVLAALAPGGVFMLVEPQSADSVEGNFHPIGRLCYATSTAVCTPSGLANGGAGLGNQVSDDAWRELLTDAGFTTVRRAAETPFTRVFDVR
jgi:2-polyprenyl-3-methyl-5-hydroxy-6-metoxy-1,4-benzoquinol methylase